MNKSNFFKSSNPKTKALIQAVLYLILIQLFLNYITSNFIEQLSFIGSTIIPVFFIFYIFLIIFTKPIAVDVDFNNNKFITNSKTNQNLKEEFNFNDVKIISLNKSYLLGFSLVFMKNFESLQSYCYTSYSNKNFLKFKKRFNQKAKLGMIEYRNFQINNKKSSNSNN